MVFVGFPDCTRAVSESFHEGAIRLENILLHQPFRTHPFEALSVEASGLTAEAFDDPHGKLHITIVVRVLQTHEGATRRHLDTQLFLELAPERILLGFPRGYFATGEFPPPGHMLPGRSLGNENTTVTVIKRGGHDEQRGPHNHSKLVRAYRGSA